MENCLFCKIITGEIPCKKVYEDENCLAFYDIYPQAPVHILVVPKIHTEAIHAEKGENIVNNLFLAVSNIVKEQNLTKKGYRLIINSGENGGQTVFHLHVHILGGTNLGDNFC